MGTGADECAVALEQRQAGPERVLNFVVWCKAGAEGRDHAVACPNLMVSQPRAGRPQARAATASPERFDRGAVHRVFSIQFIFYCARLHVLDWLSHTLAGYPAFLPGQGTAD